jgi:hypothetical protein
MNKSNELICAHSALLFVALFAAGLFGITGWLPPVSPGNDGAAIAAMFEQDRIAIRIGASLAALSSVFWIPMSAAIAMQMKRIEGHRPVLAYVQLIAAMGTTIAILLPSYLWLALAFRADTPADIMQLVNDFSWISIIGMYPPGFLQVLVVGLCVLNNKSSEQPYPRWLGYACIWVAVLFLPGALVPFFQSGPFTWNGIISFWVVATVFFGWIIMMWLMTVKAIKKEAV